MLPQKHRYHKINVIEFGYETHILIYLSIVSGKVFLKQKFQN